MASRQTRPAAYVCGAGVLLSLCAWAAPPAVAQSGAATKAIFRPINAASRRRPPTAWYREGRSRRVNPDSPATQRAFEGRWCCHQIGRPTRSAYARFVPL
jgi:hypothetical protein